MSNNIEIWKPVVGYEGLYEVSSYGRVRSLGKLHPNSKPIYQFSIDGKFIKMWDCTREVERKLGYRNSNICSCALGRHKTAYGYVWRYKEEKVA